MLDKIMKNINFRHQLQVFISTSLNILKPGQKLLQDHELYLERIFVFVSVYYNLVITKK